MKLFLMIAFFVGGGLSAWALTPDEQLAQTDRLQALPNTDFQLTITEYQGDKVVDTNSLDGWSKRNAQGNKTLLAFTAPATVKGRKMLMDGPVVYLLFPRTRNPIRLSPLQVLLGQSSNGDVARTSFSEDYNVQSVQEQTRDQHEYSVFELRAKPDRHGSTYNKITLWVDRSTHLPQEAEFFGTGDTLLKRAVYSDYKVVDGYPFAHRLEIHDGADASRYTVLEYSHLGTKALPEGAFRAAYLTSWIPGEPR